MDNLNFIYYRISDGNHAGSLALDSLWADAPENPTDEELADEGIVKIEIPPEKIGQSIFIRWLNNAPVVRFDPPPYWDELIGGLAQNPFYQRVNLLSETDLAVNRCLNRISTDVFVLNRNVEAFRWSFDRLIKALDSASAPITTEERATLEALIAQCGFPASAIEPIPEPEPEEEEEEES